MININVYTPYYLGGYSTYAVLIIPSDYEFHGGEVIFFIFFH